MNKILILIATACMAFLASCDREDFLPEEPPKEQETSLAGTTWKSWGLYDTFDEHDGGGGTMEIVLVFSSTTVSYTDTTYPYIGEERVWSFTGTYTYCPPEVTITVTSPEHLKGLISSGIIRKHTNIDGTVEEVLHYNVESLIKQ